jgi:autotransporter-associated beta strand protein
MPFRPILTTAGAFATFLLFTQVSPVFGASDNWNTTSGAWEVSGNWLNGNIPGADPADVATFGGGGGGTVTIDAGRSLSGITFSNAASNYTFTGGPLVMTAGNVTDSLNNGGGGSIDYVLAVTNTGATTNIAAGSGLTQQVFNNDFTLLGDYAFANQSTNANSSLTINGNITGSAGVGVTNELLLTGGTSAALNTNYITGSISDGANGGNLELIKFGYNTWVLSAPSTYSGGTRIGQGAVVISNAAALGTGGISIYAHSSTQSSPGHGTVRLQGNIALTNPTMTLGGSRDTGAPAHIVNVSGNNSYTGTFLFIGTSATIQSDAGKLTINGALSTNNGTGGGGSNKPLILTGSGDGEITSKMTQGSRPLGVTKNGSGTWILSNAGSGADRSNFDGVIAVNAGTLVLNLDNTLSDGAVNINGGTLRGGGILGGALTLNSNGAGGTLAPGSDGATPISDHTLNGTSLTWNEGGSMAYNLGTVTNLLTLSGAFTKGTGSAFGFNFTTDGGFAPGTYTLVNFGSTTFQEADLDTFTASGLGEYVADFGFQGNSLVVTVAVPEPGAAVLAGAGLGLCLFRRRWVGGA